MSTEQFVSFWQIYIINICYSSCDCWPRYKGMRWTCACTWIWAEFNALVFSKELIANFFFQSVRALFFGKQVQRKCVKLKLRTLPIICCMLQFFVISSSYRTYILKIDDFWKVRFLVHLTSWPSMINYINEL